MVNKHGKIRTALASNESSALVWALTSYVSGLKSVMIFSACETTDWFCATSQSCSRQTRALMPI